LISRNINIFSTTASENQPARTAPPSAYFFKTHHSKIGHISTIIFFVSSMKHTKTVFQHFSGTHEPAFFLELFPLF
jgi:hypothetical protein